MKQKISLKELVTLCAGMFIVSAAVYYIMMPSEFVVGSLAGLVMILVHFIPLKISTLTLILNLILLLIGLVFIGKEFGGKTIIASLLLPLYLRLFEWVTPVVPELTDDLFVNVLCYILILSMGQAILFNINASSGGLDIIAKLLNKYLHMDLGKGSMLAGFVTASLSILVYDRSTLVVSLVGTYLGGVVLDHFLDGFNIRKKICILSPHYTEIQKFIAHDLHRGVTIYPVLGGWNNEQRMELVTILQKNEYARLLEYVNQVDPRAFVTVATVGQVIGQWNPHIRRPKE